MKVRRYEKLDKTKERDFKKEELLRKYIVKILYKQNDRNFENEYLKKLERNW